jgi:TolA-binding protein
MAPDPGKTALEVINALSPLLQQNTNEVGRMADQLSKLNGTVQGLSVWRGGIDERHRQEDATASNAAHSASSAAASRVSAEKSSVSADESAASAQAGKMYSEAFPDKVWKRTMVTAIVCLMMGIGMGTGLVLMIGWDKIISLVK